MTASLRACSAAALSLAIAAVSAYGASPNLTDVAAEHLAAAIRCKTISHQDPAENDMSQLDALRALLEKTYPRAHRALTRDIINRHALLYTWKGSDPAAKPWLFMAHQDVVPVEPGTESSWTKPPFDGVIADGFVWGRGAIDDKASLVFLFETVEALLAEGYTPRRTIYLASGFDEEVGGREGSAKIAEELARRGVRLEAVLDEGGSVTTGVIPGVTEPVARIGVAEKGFLSVELIAEVEGGHSSMPPRHTAVGILAAAIERLERNQMPARLAGAPQELLEALAPHLPAWQRFEVANLWLFRPFVVRRLEETPANNALVRTTTAPTVFQSGVKENVLPSQARAVVNFRILQGDSTASVLAHVRSVVADPQIRVRELSQTLSEPSPLSSTSSASWGRITRTIRVLYPDAIIAPGLVVGATDSRYFAPVADDVYRFTPIDMTPTDLKRFHGTDERYEVRQIGPALDFYRRLLRDD
jgi:carboxypeptidase PM20D1